MTSDQELEENKKKLAGLIKFIGIGMLTTVDENGLPHSCPMTVNKPEEFDGNLWFFTHGNNHKVFEATRNKYVNISFSDVKNQNYVSVTGQAELIRDRTVILERWLPELKAWFQDGPETEDIALLKIRAEKAEYWDMPYSVATHTIAIIKLLTGQAVAAGENVKVDL